MITRAYPRLFSAAFILGLVAITACGSDPETTGSGGSGAGGANMGGAGGAGGTGGSVLPTWTMGDPFSTEAPSFESVTHPLMPTTKWGKLTAPYPTNAAWMDLVLGSGNNPVNMLPYEVKTLDQGLEASLPTQTTSPNTVLSVYSGDLSFRTTSLLSERALVSYDLLSATMRWTSAAGGTMTAPLVRGMPYITVVYDNLTPRVGTQHAVTAVNGGMATPVTGDRFTISLNNGQEWVLYTSESVTFNWDVAGLTATAPLTGYLRAAAVGSAQGAIDVLDAHKDAYPTGGEVSVKVQGDTAAIDFTWKKEGKGPLLMMALPHHMDTLRAPKNTTLTHKTLRGAMTGVTGDAWSFEESLPQITWNAPSGIAKDKEADVKAALTADMTVVPTAKDPYFFGKQIAKLGRLALIADELGDKNAATVIRDALKSNLDPWLEGKNDDALKYESTWGGICSKNGLASQGADFGQGYYNDHHFHYGYHIYAAAALAKGDAGWLASKKAAVTDLIRDIANPSSQDKYFTRFRNMDWFEGHSWAAGLFEFGDGRNQESTSEAVNAWYGVYLFGLAAGDENIANVGRVLLATELRGAHTYWQVKQGSAIYDEPFASHKVVGILWGNKADYATFFGAKDEYVHGIQMIPFTPITEALLPSGWVTEEYPVISNALMGTVEEGWKGFIYMDHAIIDPAAAWQEVGGLNGYDDGNTKTNTLYWVATRPTK